MSRRLALPKRAHTPSKDVLDLLGKYEVGQVLDSGGIASEWSSGQAVLTDLGIALCSPNEGEAVGVAWHELGSLPLEPNLNAATTAITLPIDGGSITFDVDSRLFANIKSAYSQLWLLEPGGSPVGPPADPGIGSLNTASPRPTLAAATGAKTFVPDPTVEPFPTYRKRPLYRRLWRRITR